MKIGRFLDSQNKKIRRSGNMGHTFLWVNTVPKRQSMSHIPVGDNQAQITNTWRTLEGIWISHTRLEDQKKSFLVSLPDGFQE